MREFVNVSPASEEALIKNLEEASKVRGFKEKKTYISVL
jgi:hypothetical protein